VKFDLNIKEERISKETILKYISEYDIYAYYLGIFDVGKIYSSPFRKDNTPSFGIFHGKYGDLSFNDYKLGGGDCITFVQWMEKCDYKTALHILNKRYNLGFVSFGNNSKFTHEPTKTNIIPKLKEELWISIKKRNWEAHDKDYWSQYEISRSTLDKFNVIPISHFWLNQWYYIADKYSYAYRFDKNVYKIYQPYLKTGKGKWWSNIKDKDIYQGYNQLSYTDRYLFITSSLKDVMVLYELNYSAIAPHTEHQILTEELFDYYQQRFSEIIILYDNDEAGQLHANKMVDKYNLKSLVIPDEETKDPSDFVKKYDLNSLEQWIIQSIN
jgi:hypothetical protein